MLLEHQDRLREVGWYLFRYVQHMGRGGRPDVMGLVPTGDKYQVIALLGTAGVDRDVSTEQIIRWLERVESQQPIRLDEIGLDFVAGKFTAPIDDPDQLARQMYEFCPDIVEHGIGSVSALSRELHKKPADLYLWWR